MATQPTFDLVPETFAAPEAVRRHLAIVPEVGNYNELERTAPGIALRGVHPATLGLLVGEYAVMLLTFWTFFARDAATALVLTVVSVFMILYFALIAGGIVLADGPAPGEHLRSFSAFIKGPVDILTGTITGREAAIQMLFIPACMAVLATIIGIIARVSQMG
jgi:hypothetical protein